MLKIYCTACGAFSQGYDEAFALSLWEHPEDFFSRAFWRGVNLSLNAKPKRKGLLSFLTDLIEDAPRGGAQ